MKIFKNRSGFTLLELLVVISIIGILIAIGSAAFSTAQKKGRDARRRADIKALQDGFEQYYSENDGSYVASCATMTGNTDYFPAGPLVDPKGASYDFTNYYTVGVTDGCELTSYVVCAILETGGGNSSSGTSMVPVTDGAFGAFFCLTSLQ